MNPDGNGWVESAARYLRRANFSFLDGHVENRGDWGYICRWTSWSGYLAATARTTLAGNVAKIQNRNTFAAVLVAAVDERPLAASNRILILHLTDVKNSGMKFADAEMSVPEHYGTLPQLMRRGETEITLAAQPGMKLYACDFDGSRIFELPVVEKMPGKIQFTARNVTEKGAVAVYELVKEQGNTNSQS
ncbi:hypothetical protein SDC9_103889 [bioreactor metagenome]|uniref:Uncharacterized protein n=1 Tax=bioreactor metagenome TaxID=1076179 RepID=A0A645AXP4_9ZZZZ